MIEGITPTMENNREVFYLIDASKIREIASTFRERKMRLMTLTSVDLNDKIEVIYHFDGSEKIVHVKIDLPKDRPEIDSIVDIYPNADFGERESHDLMGVTFKGNSMKRLVLPRNWPDGLCPMRKDFVPPKEVHD